MELKHRASSVLTGVLLLLGKRLAALQLPFGRTMDVEAPVRSIGEDVGLCISVLALILFAVAWYLCGRSKS